MRNRIEISLLVKKKRVKKWWRHTESYPNTLLNTSVKPAMLPLKIGGIQCCCTGVGLEIPIDLH